MSSLKTMHQTTVLKIQQNAEDEKTSVLVYRQLRWGYGVKRTIAIVVYGFMKTNCLRNILSRSRYSSATNQTQSARRDPHAAPVTVPLSVPAHAHESQEVILTFVVEPHLVDMPIVVRRLQVLQVGMCGTPGMLNIAHRFRPIDALPYLP